MVLLSLFDIGFPGDGNARPDHSTSQSQEGAPDESVPTAIRSPPSSTLRVYIGDPYVRDAARRVMDEAAHRLSFPECQQLLSDFADENGQPLHGKLTELGVSAVEYLRLIIFEDGTNRSRCREGRILAFTSPGSRVIYVCGRDFMRAAQREPEDVRAIVIHEMLHSLGLGENPPSSREITRRVRERCWR
jgi:hypothetical protein